LIGIESSSGTKGGDPHGPPPPRERSAAGGNLLSFLLFSLAALLLVYLYVASERCVYFWDFSCFWDNASKLAAAFRRSFPAGMDLLLYTIRVQDYNFILTLPSSLVFLLLGESRPVFILSLTLLYAIPAAWLLHRLLARFTRELEGRIPFPGFLVTAVLLLLFPMFWAPILRGYPGIGGLVLALLVLGVYFRSPDTRIPLLSALAMGVLLGVLQLSRRFFSFWIVSFFLLAALDAGRSFLKTRPRTPRTFLATFGPLFVAGLAASAVVLGLAWDFVHRAATTDYGEIYSAYKKAGSLGDVLAEMIPPWFGLLGAALFLLSASILAFSRKYRRIVLFLTCQGILTALLHESVQGMRWSHLYLVLPTFLVPTGLLLFEVLSRLPSPKASRAFLGVLFLLGALTTGTYFVPALRPLHHILSPLVPSDPAYPLQRKDAEELGRLVSFLQEKLSKAPPSAKIYILSSSERFNEDTLREAGRSLGISFDYKDRILDLADVDRRDVFPDNLLEAEFVILAYPFQGSLSPGEQTVLLAPAFCFLYGIGIAQAYRPYPEIFRLERGLKVAVFRRQRPVKPAEILVLSQILKIFHPKRPFIYLPRAWRKKAAGSPK